MTANGSGLRRVLIVGGGIGGLATAAGLQRAGIECEVLERAPAWAPIGAGIVLSVNAMAVMRRLGIAEEVAHRGERLGAGSITDASGRALGRSDFRSIEPEFGPTVAIHRAALHETLLAAAREIPVALGTSIVACTQHDAGVDVCMTDGREATFDLVIGADGIRSQVRALTFGELPLSYSGYTCWRMVVRLPHEHAVLREMWGCGKRFGIVPIDADHAYAFAVANAPPGQGDPLDGRVERFQERFSEFGGQVPEILACLHSPDELIHNDLEELLERRWFDRRVVLLGDAAHAMTPNMGQGAAMALEDSMVLVEELESTRRVEEALRRYVERRESRVRWVQDQSRRIGRAGQLDDPFLCRARNALLRLIPDRFSTGALRRLASQTV